MIFIYEFLASVAILSGILVITTTSPVVSVLYLIAVFVSVACYLIILGVSFIGLSYIVVYVGAIAVLILFVIIILNIRLAEITSIGSAYTKNLPISALLGFTIFYQLFAIIPSTYINNNNSVLLGTINNTSSTMGDINYSYYNTSIYAVYNTIIPESTFSTTIGIQVQAIGTILYSVAPVWLIIISVILLLAIVAPIVLSRDLYIYLYLLYLI